MATTTPPTVDAIVVTWNSAPELPSCLAALPSTVRVLAVDNGSSDDSAGVAERYGATLVRLDRNSGFAHAVNRGLEQVSAPMVLLLNPDVVVQRGAVERCAEILQGDPSIGIVGPNTRQVDGKPEPPAARRDRSAVQILAETLALTRMSRRLDPQMIHDRSHDRDVEAVNGAFMLLRSETLRALGGMDETVFMYLEDADLCRRARDAGLRVRFAADAFAVHGAGTSTARGTREEQVRAYLNRIDADVEFLRRYRSRPAPVVASLTFALRAFLGLVVTTMTMPERRLRYRAALPFALRQLRGRHPAPPV